MNERKVNVGGKLYSPDELIGRAVKCNHFWDRTILCIGEKKYFWKDSKSFQESSSPIHHLEAWKLKPKTKTVKIERWLNIYEGGVIILYTTKEGADSSGKERIACEHFVKEYEIEVEG